MLAAFSNHPGGMIHWTALRQCKPFLNPSHRAAFVKEDSERKERGDGKGGGPESAERARGRGE